MKLGRLGDGYEFTFEYGVSERKSGSHKYLRVHDLTTQLISEYHLRIEQEMLNRLSVKQLKSLIKKAQEELERRAK